LEDAVETDAPKTEDGRPKELSIFEEMLNAIKEMVEGNHREIQDLKNELSSRRSRREDTSRIEARLADEERRSQELLDKLGETETRLASSEAKNRSLAKTDRTQDELLEKKKALEFTEEELEHLSKFSTIIVFDTCSIMNYPNLLDGVNDGELVIVPKVVNNELEYHKVKHFFDDRQKKAQRAISAIFNYKIRFPLEYAESLLDLVPAEYRVDEGEKELNDNKILAVAIRYKAYTDIPVIFITDDKSLANRADGEGIEVWTAKDFLTPPETSFDEDGADEIDEVVSEDANAAEEERKQKAQEEYLAQKISTKLLHLESSQISLLQNYGVKTLAQFMAQTEENFSMMKAKNGMTFTAKFLKEQSAMQHKLESL
jgi:rRNA-processing protein FCF1